MSSTMKSNTNSYGNSVYGWVVLYFWVFPCMCVTWYPMVYTCNMHILHVSFLCFMLVWIDVIEHLVNQTYYFRTAYLQISWLIRNIHRVQILLKRVQNKTMRQAYWKSKQEMDPKLTAIMHHINNNHASFSDWEQH